MSNISCLKENNVKKRLLPLSVPEPGRSLISTTEPLALIAREAVGALIKGIDNETVHLYTLQFGPRDGRLSSSNLVTPMQVAWALVGMWSTIRLLTTSRTNMSITFAEQCFFGGSPGASSVSETIPLKNRQIAEEALFGIKIDALRDLLPYILDRHGPSTRRDTLRDQNNIVFQEERRCAGAYYTPSDVADYMSEWVMDEWHRVKILDPACGSGVFLLALAKQLISKFGDPLSAIHGLYGIDIDPVAIDASCFVLTAFACQFISCLQPARVWHLIRLNMAVRDTLTIQTEANVFTPNGVVIAIRAQFAEYLADNKKLLPKAIMLENNVFGETVETLFPEISAGFDVVIGNPPYSVLGQRQDLRFLAKNFSTLHGVKVSSQTNAYIPFLNLMWSLVKTNGRSAMIVPMSVAYHSAAPFRALRQAIADSGGEWTLRFFDRTPDAIFGDDVKQRTAILLRDGNNSTTKISTSGIHRWTSRSRASLFSSLPQTLDISEKNILYFIPKMSMDWERLLYEGIQEHNGLLASTIKCYDKGTDGTDFGDSVIGVGSTAYNWLVLYRKIFNTNNITNSVLYKTQSTEIADWLYAVLASRITLWLWRVQGDAFHVPMSFVLHLPYSWQPQSQIHHNLAALGMSLWDNAQCNPVVSSNSGRQTTSFRTSDLKEIDAIDQLVLNLFGLPASIGEELKTFVENMISVGRERKCCN